MNDINSFSDEEIAEYYDNCEVHYRKHLKLDQCLAMHYGYWRPETKSIVEALGNTNKVLAEKARIVKEDRVLDAGCGVGGSSVYLARTIGCSALGITVSDHQVEAASNNASRFGVGDLASFECRNFCDTGLESGSFDVVWGVESICHANDKKAFVEEAYRLLGSNGRLVMADFFRTRDAESPEDERILSEWLDGWAVPGIETIEGFTELLRNAGFRIVTAENSTKQIYPSAKWLYRRFLISLPIQKFYEWFSNPLEIQKQNARTAKLQYDSLKKGLWAYYVLVAEKSEGPS